MSHSAYWLRVCRTRAPRIVESRWCRALLEEAATRTVTTGFRGRMWVFPDGSRLVATDDGETVMPREAVA